MYTYITRHAAVTRRVEDLHVLNKDKVFFLRNIQYFLHIIQWFLHIILICHMIGATASVRS